MHNEEKYDVPTALYHSVGKYIALDTISEQQKEKIIQKAIELRAVRTLEAMRRILEDDRFSDPECFEVVDTLVTQFFEELEIRIDRHSELG